MNNVLPFPPARELPLRPQPPDAVVREEALDIHRSFIVQAPAGSGKTALLIRRFLKLLADGSVTQPEQVLAITFTKAATAEMRDRVLGYLARARAEFATAADAPLELAAAASPGAEATEDIDRLALTLAGAVLARDAELGWHLLAHPHRLNIRTIDSVCSEIANSLPVLSGSGGRLAPTEDAAPLYREAARRTLLHLGSDDPAFNAALRNLLLHRDGNLDDCETLLAEMLALREQWGELVPLRQTELDDAWLDANLLPRLERTLEHAISAALARLDALFPSDVLRELASLAGHLGHLPGTSGDASPIACCAGAHGAPEATAAHIKHWLALVHLLVTGGGDWRRRYIAGDLKFELDKNHPGRAKLAAIVDQLRGRDNLLEAIDEVRRLPPPQYPADQWTVAKSLFRVLNRALVELQLVFAANSQCDFTELGLLARTALADDAGPGDLTSALGARLQHLLVDEMQDTSAGQYRLLEQLTASWDGHSQTVFLVGDPYQSIYLFRQASVERFVHALETLRLGELPLTPLALTANFRSQRTLVEQFNEDFGLIFPRPTERDRGGDTLHFIHANSVRPTASSAAGRLWHANPQQPSAASPLAVTQAQRDAEAIATTAAEWLARPLPPDRDEPWRIAVLVRSRNHLTEVILALRRAQVPFRAVDIETLHDRQEVLDLTALARALLHPADRVAGLAVLRAPWCGLPLADLHLLTGADDPALKQHSILRLIDSRAHLLSQDSQQRLARVEHVLRSSAQNRARLTTAQLVERAWRSLGGDAPLTPAELTNARRFFELLDVLEASAGRIDSTQLEDRLMQLYAESDPLPERSGCVELLTIHKAKGLEWDLVFVPALERSPAFTPNRLLTWAVLDDLEDASTHILLAPIAARGEDVDPLTTWLKRRHREREYSENKRLLYVACTRTRDELHLFAAPALTMRGVSNGPADSLLRAAWPAAEAHFAAGPRVIQANADDSETSSAADFDDAIEDGTKSFLNNEIKDYPQATDVNLIPPLYPVIERLPSSFDPTARLREAGTQRLPYGEPSAAVHDAQFARPEGSFAARSFGNTVHACIETLTARIAGGATPGSLLAELPSWSARITALLRTDGLPATTVSRLAREARTALENLLRDPAGQWLLAPHPGAAAEFSLTAASTTSLSTVRADRIFRAGPEPGTSGDTHLWIVDYKTVSHGTPKIEEFLAAQRVAYAPQLETYARILAPAQSVPLENVRLTLYFLALTAPQRLMWWPLETDAGASPHSRTIRN